MIYLRLRHKVFIKQNGVVKIGDIAQLIGDETILKKIKDITIHHVKKSDKNIVIIDGMHVIREITNQIKDLEIQTIGTTQTIIEIIYPKKKYSHMFFILVWLLLFFGSGIAIMNFHEDVSMLQVHQHLYKIMTGEEIAKPLILQIPYSIGLGAGMILFFNHLFKKRINEEPSPLEVEMFNYQRDLDAYVMMTESEESMKSIDDR